MLYKKASHSDLVFGLYSRAVLSSLAQPSNAECRIQYFREVALVMGLEDSDAVIPYTAKSDGREYFEFATAISYEMAKPGSGKRLRSCNIKQQQSVHTHWFKNNW